MLQHCIVGLRGKVAGKKPMCPNNCSPSHRRQFCTIELSSVPWLQSPWTNQTLSTLHSSSLVGSQARIGLVGTRVAILTFAAQNLAVSILSGHKISIHQMLPGFTISLKQFMTCTPISPLNTSGTWTRRASNLVEAVSSPKKISIFKV